MKCDDKNLNKRKSSVLDLPNIRREDDKNEDNDAIDVVGSSNSSGSSNTDDGRESITEKSSSLDKGKIYKVGDQR